MNAQANERSENRALEQAQAQANSIAAMVAALNVDYDRLEELKDERESLRDAATDNELNMEEHLQACKELANWLEENEEQLKELEEAANGNENEEGAREAIQQDALDVQVRSDWHTPSTLSDSASEFYILLCTGGPAVRIMGELDDNCYPCRAWIQAQDWGTGWMEAPGIIDQDTLLTYCRQFWFGE